MGQNLLIIMLNHLLVISCGVTVMGMMRQEQHMVWLWWLLLGIPLLFYLAKIKIRNFFLFYALHLAVPVAAIFLPIPMVPKFLVILIGIVYFIWAVKLGIVPQEQGEGVLGPTAMTCALGVMLLVEIFYNQKGWENIYITLAIIYAAGYSLYLFISRYLRFLSVNENNVAYIPEEEIFSKGFCQSFLYMAGVVTLLVLTAKLELLSFIESRIVSLFGNVFKRIFLSIFIEEDVAEKAPEKLTPQEEEMLGEAVDPGLIWDMLEKSAKIAVTLFLVAAVLFGLVKGFQYLWKEFYKNSSKEEKVGNSSIDIRETCKIEKTKKEGNNRFGFLDNQGKIRKIYRKQVLKHKAAIIGDLETEYLEYMTAEECCEKITAEQLKNMYEKARYSGETITSDDVKATKSGIR